MEADLAAEDVPQQVSQGGHIEDVLEAGSEGLHDHGEAGVLHGDAHELLCPEPLGEQGHALSGPAAWEEQRPRGVLPELAGEERRPGQLVDDAVVELFGLGHQEIDLRGLIA